MVSYRSSPPPNEILCGDCKTEFKSPLLKCQTCKIYYHPICAEIPLYYMVRYASSSVSFVCKLCTEKSAEPHWTETVHLFKWQHNRSRPTKMTITSRNDQEQFKQLQPASTIRTAKGNNNQ